MTPNVIKQQITGNVFVDTYRVSRNEKGIGRKYNIKGLYTLLKSFSGIDIPNEVRKDLDFYKAYRKKKKEQWNARKRKSRLEKEAQVPEQVL